MGKTVSVLSVAVGRQGLAVGVLQLADRDCSTFPANDNMCGSMTGEKKPLIEGQLWLGADIDKLDLSVPHPVPTYIGELQAWDVAAGKKVWSQKFPHQLFASVLSTGGDLVFVGGTSDRYFRAFNAKTGELSMAAEDQLRHHG